jgi:hypothetical protein
MEFVSGCGSPWVCAPRQRMAASNATLNGGPGLAVSSMFWFASYVRAFGNLYPRLFKIALGGALRRSPSVTALVEDLVYNT